MMRLMLNELTTDDKLRLLRFMCAFAWADLEIADKERAFVIDLIARMRLPPPDAALAESWLDHPPAEEEVDPYDIPDDHRRIFLEAALEMVGMDGVVDPLEAESFAIFEALVALDDSEDDES